MRGNRNSSLALAMVIGIGTWAFASPAAVADEPAQHAPEAAQTQQPAALQSQPQVPQAGQTQQCAAAQQPGDRIKVTGSNILRHRSDCSLPLLTLDRGYIDQTGAFNPSGVIRSVPQAQSFGR